MERKFIDLKSLKVSDENSGTIEGYRSVFGIIDEGGDIVVKGAFADTMDEYLHEGFTAHSHDWNFSEAVGFPVKAYEDDHGWFVVSQFHSTPDAQAIRTKAKERMDAGKQVGFSFGYAPREYVFVEAKDYKEQLPQYVSSDYLPEALIKAQKFSRIRILKKVEAIEDSLVTAPMNKRAAATGVKSQAKKWETVDDEIHYRAKDRTDFEDDFQVKTIEADSKIEATVGKLKSGTIAVQALQFPSDDWTLAEAKKWVKEHSDLDSLIAEEVKGMLAEEMAQTTPSTWEVQSAFARVIRKIAESAKNGDVTGIEFDWKAKATMACSELGSEMTPLVLNQIQEFLDSTDDEFYLKDSVSDSFESFDKAVAAIEKNTAQMRRNHENRLKEGRVLSSSNRTKIQNCMDSLMALHAELSDLMTMSEPKPKEKEIDVDALRTQSLRIQSSAMRALSS